METAVEKTVRALCRSIVAGVIAHDITLGRHAQAIQAPVHIAEITYDLVSLENLAVINPRLAQGDHVALLNFRRRQSQFLGILQQRQLHAGKSNLRAAGMQCLFDCVGPRRIAVAAPTEENINRPPPHTNSGNLSFQFR